MYMNFERPLLFGLSGTLVLLIMFISIEHGVYAISISIESPLSNQQVPVGELKISGTSSDNSSAQCQVYVDWNNLKPYQSRDADGFEREFRLFNVEFHIYFQISSYSNGT